MGKSRLTNTEKHNIVMEYIYGVSPNVISERYNISINYVYILFKQMGPRIQEMIRKNASGKKVGASKERALASHSKKAREIDYANRKDPVRKPQKLRPLSKNDKAAQKFREELAKAEGHGLPNNKLAVQNIKHCSRGFIIPPHLEKEYTKLLMTGMPRKEAALQIAPELNQHLKEYTE